MGGERIPHDLDEITPTWLENALGVRAAVRGFEVEPLGEGRGFLGEIARLRIDGYGDAAVLPASVVVKLPSRNPQARQLGCQLGVYEREIRYYEECDAASPIRTPRRLYSDRERDTSRYVLLLEDVTDAIAGDQTVGLDEGQLESALAMIGRFHAAWWDRPDLDGLDWVPRWNDPAIVGVVQFAYQSALPAFHAHFDGEVAPEMSRLVDELSGRIGALAAELATPPCALVHGDYRADNLLFHAGCDPRENGLTVVDWHLLARGCAVFDVAYLLGQSTEVELRRRREASLLDRYHTVLCENGVRHYDIDACWRHYRMGVLYGMVYIVIAANLINPSDERGVELVRASTLRASSAAADLEVWQLLG